MPPWRRLALADERAVELEQIRARANQAKDRFRRLELRRAAKVLRNADSVAPAGLPGGMPGTPVLGRVFLTDDVDTSTSRSEAQRDRTAHPCSCYLCGLSRHHKWRKSWRW